MKVSKFIANANKTEHCHCQNISTKHIMQSWINAIDVIFTGFPILVYINA